jgi:hypothetical protein
MKLAGVFLELLVVVPARAGTQAAPSISQRVGAACRTTAIHPEPYHGRTTAPPGLPWMRATPRSSRIIGFLFYISPGATGDVAALHTGGRMPDGAATKILWFITKPGAQRTLLIVGRNRRGAGTMRERVPAASTGYPSILTIPTAGCWRLTLRSGSVSGQVTLTVLP